MPNLTTKIGLGSAQWGMNYGIANTTGKALPQEIEKILGVARDSCISVIDTAPLYGDAERQLGKHDLSSFSIITKTPHFPCDSISKSSVDILRSTFLNSLRLLGQEKVYCLLVHNADDLLKPNSRDLINELQQLKNEGLVKKIGISIYTAEQLHRITSFFVPDIVQLPLNVFDQRLIHDGSLITLKSMGVEIHVRSALLQGLLATNEDRLPEYFSPWKQNIKEWLSFCSSISVSPAHAAIGFVCNIQEIDFCILGVERLPQLTDILDGLGNALPFDASSFAMEDSMILNPSNWKLV